MNEINHSEYRRKRRIAPGSWHRASEHSPCKRIVNTGRFREYDNVDLGIRPDHRPRHCRQVLE
jgi:hypothetical protein